MQNFKEQKLLLYICSLSLSSFYRFVDTLLYPLGVLKFCKCDRIVTKDFMFGKVKSIGTVQLCSLIHF